MMAQRRENVQTAFEQPRRVPRSEPGRVPRTQPRPEPRRQSMPVRLDDRREAQRELLRRQAEARRRRGLAMCALMAAGLMVLVGMRIYQSSAVTANAEALRELRDEIHELTMDAETYERRIAEASAEERIISGAERLGMSYPVPGQVRAVKP